MTPPSQPTRGLRDLEEELERLRTETVLLRRRAERAEDELGKVQAHLTQILSSRLFRYTRRLRRLWYRLKGSP